VDALGIEQWLRSVEMIDTGEPEPVPADAEQSPACHSQSNLLESNNAEEVEGVTQELSPPAFEPIVVVESLSDSQVDRDIITPVILLTGPSGTQRTLARRHHTVDAHLPYPLLLDMLIRHSCCSEPSSPSSFSGTIVMELDSPPDDDDDDDDDDDASSLTATTVSDTDTTDSIQDPFDMIDPLHNHPHARRIFTVDCLKKPVAVLSGEIYEVDKKIGPVIGVECFGTFEGEISGEI